MIAVLASKAAFFIIKFCLLKNLRKEEMVYITR